MWTFARDPRKFRRDNHTEMGISTLFIIATRSSISCHIPKLFQSCNPQNSLNVRNGSDTEVYDEENPRCVLLCESTK